MTAAPTSTPLARWKTAEPTSSPNAVAQARLPPRRTPAARNSRPMPDSATSAPANSGTASGTTERSHSTHRPEDREGTDACPALLQHLGAATGVCVEAVAERGELGEVRVAGDRAGVAVADTGEGVGPYGVVPPAAGVEGGIGHRLPHRVG